APLALPSFPTRRSSDLPLDLLDLRGQLPVRRIEVARAAVLAQRLFQLAARLGQLRLVQMLVRRVDHRALERNLVVAPVGRFLHRSEEHTSELQSLAYLV